MRYDWKTDRLGLDQPELPRLTAQDLRRVSASFAQDTAETIDGFHVRGFQWLDDDGLEVLSRFYGLVEKRGFGPSQVAAIAMPLIPKPNGGRRLVGL